MALVGVISARVVSPVGILSFGSDLTGLPGLTGLVALLVGLRLRVRLARLRILLARPIASCLRGPRVRARLCVCGPLARVPVRALLRRLTRLALLTLLTRCLLRFVWLIRHPGSPSLLVGGRGLTWLHTSHG